MLEAAHRLSVFALALLAALVFASSATAADTVWSWGLNNQGELGHGPYTGPASCGTAGSCATSPVGALAGASAVAAGLDHSLAIRSGVVYAWGDDRFGELGASAGTSTCAGSQPCRPKPVVTKVKGAVAVAAGNDFSLALLSNGTVKAWGNNSFGQLGDGTTTGTAAPQLVSGLSTVKAIAAGGSHALALLSNGTVMAWGANNSGQLGNGTNAGPDTCLSSTPCSTTPVPVGSPGNAPLQNVHQIAAGAAFSLALVGSSYLQVDVWGDNTYGELGQGTTGGTRTTPEVISSLGGVTNGIAASGESEQALALLTDGTVAAWGDNTRGQSGSACGNPCPTPKLVPGVSGATAIATSSAFTQARSLALTSNGKVLEWGSAPLGDGTSSAGSATPVTVTGFSGPTAIAAGGQQSLAIALPPPNRFSVGLTTCVCTVATLKVKLPAPGLLLAFQGPGPRGLAGDIARAKRLLKRASKNVLHAGTVKLKLRLTAAGRRKLRHKHKLKIKVTISFTPTGGTTSTQTVTVTFRKR